MPGKYVMQSLITAIQDGLLKFSHLQPISDPLHRLVQPEYRIDSNWRTDKVKDRTWGNSGSSCSNGSGSKCS
ncbi:hypothetical protein TYRP_009994 [Tyrophagus putrescentiae]|nr:hypothetical protein TYRP_009994 [Tyrophagus putrescentiae]